MQRDLKDVIGVLMRVLGGGEVSPEELDDLGFDADGELLTALNEAYITLRAFAHDRELRRNDRDIDRQMQLALQDCLDNIVRVCDREKQTIARDPTA
jgi:hypothetical protein